jgi:hypothetical protein
VFFDPFCEIRQPSFFIRPKLLPRSSFKQWREIFVILGLIIRVATWRPAWCFRHDEMKKSSE